ncbi:MAG: hypothetical protein CL760_07145 [Chloroflexi bacterium]|nr:hypothetical protein [Chloroflexota bacterium]|tara:strand:- start:40574 stop:41650 length:1077 start_codon:yes stop_codon:yes gene_type:complete
MRYNLISISLIALLSACSTIEKETQTTNTTDYFSYLTEKGNDSFYLTYSSKGFYDYTICKSYDHSKSILQESCQEPIFISDNVRFGVLEQKQSIGSITLEEKNSQFTSDFNIHSIVFENGDKYQSLNIKKNHPFQKLTMNNHFYEYNLVLDEMKELNIIDDYSFINGNLIFSSKNKGYILDKRDTKDLKYISKYINIKENQNILEIFSEVEIVFDQEYVSVFITTNFDVDYYQKKQLIDIESVNNNIKGEEDVFTTILVVKDAQFKNKDIDFIKLGHHRISKDNFKHKIKRNNVHVFYLDSKKYNKIIKKSINNNSSMSISVQYKDQSSSYSNIKITEEEKKKINNVLDLISISQVKK